MITKQIKDLADSSVTKKAPAMIQGAVLRAGAAAGTYDIKLKSGTLLYAVAGIAGYRRNDSVLLSRQGGQYTVIAPATGKGEIVEVTA